MTSDAKIGLLLGLAFIFIIAFILNGLPNFSKDSNNNELTTETLGSQDSPPGIGTGQRKVSREVINRIRPAKRVRIPQATDNQEIRFKTPLPKSPSESKKAVEVRPTTPSQPLHAAEKKEITHLKTGKTTLPKVYIVSEGDNLAVIAKKFYGTEDGNKKVNIARIFQANRRLLKSPDEIYQGQKLIIPLLSASSENSGKTSNILASPMLEKVESIGKRHFSADPPAADKSEKSRRYVVQQGDSLWRIAAETLGDGSRYGEIAGLNDAALDDEDSLTVGMRLKIPAR